MKRMILALVAVIALGTSTLALADQAGPTLLAQEVQPPPPAYGQPPPAPTYGQPYPPQPAYPQPRYVVAGPPPRPGIGLIVAGSILIGAGLISLAISPFCVDRYTYTDVYGEDACIAGFVVGGLVAIGIGTPLLIVGAVRQSRYSRWRRAGYSFLEGIRPTASHNTAGLSWQVRF